MLEVNVSFTMDMCLSTIKKMVLAQNNGYNPQEDWMK